MEILKQAEKKETISFNPSLFADVFTKIIFTVINGWYEYNIYLKLFLKWNL